jgi:hypothetical protein
MEGQFVSSNPFRLSDAVSRKHEPFTVTYSSSEKLLMLDVQLTPKRAGLRVIGEQLALALTPCKFFEQLYFFDYSLTVKSEHL